MNFEIEPRYSFSLRLVLPSEEAQWSRLMDSSFLVPNGHHFIDDFPIWGPLHPRDEVVRLGVFQGNSLISGAGVRLVKLKTTQENKTLEVGVIGAVATHSEWRGRGLASSLVQHAVHLAKEGGADLIVLWGSEHSLYQKLGFELCGRQMRCRLDTLTLMPATKARQSKQNDPKALKIIKGWSPEIFSLLKSRSEGFVLKDKDQIWYAAHKNVEWYSTQVNDRVTAYAGVGRGIDLKDIIHEWGGEAECLQTLLSFIQKDKPNAELLGSPRHFERWTMAPEESFSLGSLEYLCMAKIINPEKLSSVDGFPLSLWVWGLDAA